MVLCSHSKRSECECQHCAAVSIILLSRQWQLHYISSVSASEPIMSLTGCVSILVISAKLHNYTWTADASRLKDKKKEIIMAIVCQISRLLCLSL